MPEMHKKVISMCLKYDEKNDRSVMQTAASNKVWRRKRKINPKILNHHLLQTMQFFYYLERIKLLVLPSTVITNCIERTTMHISRHFCQLVRKTAAKEKSWRKKERNSLDDSMLPVEINDDMTRH